MWEKKIVGTKYMLANDSMCDDIKRDHGDSFPLAYQLHALDEHGEFRGLSRLLGIDPEGILYIGKSKTVQPRIANLRKSVCAAYRKVGGKIYEKLVYMDFGAHQTGKKIVTMPRFVEFFPFERLCLTVEPCWGRKEGKGVVDPADLEAQLQQAYMARYGENPPLND